MKKIIIVEDDPLLVEIYQKKFEQDGNFEIAVASTGAELDKKIQEGKPSLILLDLVLPEVDGFGVLEKIRANKNLDDVKVIIFSNLSQQEEKDRAKELGADDFIIKSDYTPSQIVDKIKSIMKE